MWRKRIQDFLANRLNLELKELSVPKTVSSGCDFLGYVTRPHYKLVRCRVLHHCLEKLAELERKLLRKDAKALSLGLNPIHRDALQATLASYFSHYQHASSFRLQQSIFSSFPWLNLLFDVCSIENNTRKLSPRWRPAHVGTFYGQYSWFQSCFNDFVQLIQVGRSFACARADMALLPMVVQRKMKKCETLSTVQYMYTAPLSMLKGVRGFLRRSGVAHVFVAEEGYLRSGLRERVLRLLWQPNQALLPI